MSNFAGLETARKGLVVSQKAIELTSHNISNANTEGYTRQRLVTQGIDPAAGLSHFSNPGYAAVGLGVEIVSIDQIRNPFLDTQYRQEASLASAWNTRSESLGYIESLFNELTGTGLGEAFDQFSQSVQELTKNPSAAENRTNMLQNAISLVETFAHYTAQLDEIQLNQDTSAGNMVAEINTQARSIADLNTQIAMYELSGNKANDLRDQRGLLLDQLAERIDFSAHENSQGELQVFVGGQILIDHQETRAVLASPTRPNPLDPAGANLNELVWADNATPFAITSGSLKATLDLRDGDTADDAGIVYLKNQLDRLARSLADTFNAIHSTGWTLPDSGTGTASQTGLDFFVSADGGPVTAGTIQVSAQIKGDTNLIAASDQQITEVSQLGNNRQALKLAGLFDSTSIPDIESYSGFLNGLVSTIAVECRQANNTAANEKTLLRAIDAQRDQISGVSMDEETANLIKYQHSYNAAARVISTIDEMLDVLVNRTGVVGR